MSRDPLSRRPLLRSALSLAALTQLPLAAPALAAPAGRVATPRQTPGPFYPTRLPADADNDLVTVSGRSQPAHGQVMVLTGRVIDLAERPVRDARVEIWQCDVFGRYHHVDSSWQTAALDENFQGYGRTVTAVDGTYGFRTIKPVAYAGRAPHVHFAVSGPGIERFVTQMYLAGEPLNERDPVFSHIREPRARQSVTVALTPAEARGPGTLGARFDIVLG